VVLFLLNQLGKQLKNDYIEEYSVRKIVESFFNMEVVDEVKIGEDVLNINEMIEEI